LTDKRTHAERQLSNSTNPEPTHSKAWVKPQGAKKPTTGNKRVSKYCQRGGASAGKYVRAVCRLDVHDLAVVSPAYLPNPNCEQLGKLRHLAILISILLDSV
jgi:hypothetical protein